MNEWIESIGHLLSDWEELVLRLFTSSFFPSKAEKGVQEDVCNYLSWCQSNRGKALRRGYRYMSEGTTVLMEEMIVRLDRIQKSLPKNWWRVGGVSSPQINITNTVYSQEYSEALSFDGNIRMSLVAAIENHFHTPPLNGDERWVWEKDEVDGEIKHFHFSRWLNFTNIIALRKKGIDGKGEWYTGRKSRAIGVVIPKETGYTTATWYPTGNDPFNDMDGLKMQPKWWEYENDYGEKITIHITNAYAYCYSCCDPQEVFELFIKLANESRGTKAAS